MQPPSPVTSFSFSLKPKLLNGGSNIRIPKVRSNSFRSILMLKKMKKKEAFGGKYLQRSSLLKLGQNWLRDFSTKLFITSYKE